MAFVIGAIRVKDFSEWKKGFDENPGMRQRAGMKAYEIFQSVDDPGVVVVCAEFPDAETAKKLLQSDEMKEANQQSGVLEMLDMRFVERVDAANV